MKPDHTSASRARDHPGLPEPNVRGCIKIDLVTDTAAILNLLDLSSGGEVSPRKYVVQSACQYDVTSRVGSFQNGEQIVHRRNG